MRKAINENPMVQIAVLAIGVVAFGLILMMSMGGGSDTSATTDPGAAAAPESAATNAASSSAEVPGAPVTPVTPDPAPESSGTVTPPATSSPEPPATGGATGSADGMLPSKGLPQDLLVAYAKGDAIALLVADPDSVSFRKMNSAVESLGARDDVSAFIVETKDIAKYSRITSGVSVSRDPALIVIRPRKLTDNVPTATVSYGFRGHAGVEQAIEDALYKGRQRGIYP